jgi:transcriptional regulator of arginine metabolism
MPVDQKERRQDEILSILMTGFPIRHQKELVAQLKEKGIKATQSSVSRDLDELGAVRVEGVYELPQPTEKEEAFFKPYVSFIEEARTAGPYQLLIRTFHQSGYVVANAIESVGWREVVGTIASPESVLVLTETAADQKRFFHRLHRFLVGI